MRRGDEVRARTDMRYPGGGKPGRRALPARPLPLARLAAGLAALGLSLAAGCSIQPVTGLRQAAVSCSQFRLDSAQQLFLAARTNLVRYYKERGLATLNAAFGLAGDSIQAARATRNCSDFDNRVRAAALNIIATDRQLRTLAFSTMRDPGEQTIVTLLQEQYGEAFAGRDLD